MSDGSMRQGDDTLESLVADADPEELFLEVQGMAGGLTPEERLAAVEANQKHIERAILATNANIRELTKTVGTLSQGLAGVTEALKHPPKEHCFLLEDMAEVKEWRKHTDTDVSTLKERADKFEGGMKVVIALIGGGNLLVIIAIIGALVWLSQHLKGAAP